MLHNVVIGMCILACICFGTSVVICWRNKGSTEKYTIPQIIGCILMYFALILQLYQTFRSI